MYDDDAFRAELRTARDSFLRFVLIVSSLGVASGALWLLIAWLAG